ncbi:hypothetical protein BKP30_27105 [Rhodococcus erythropolis]|nr:hypothetical protein BKP30_27105 [Rhodococcus erythropolis]
MGRSAVGTASSTRTVRRIGVGVGVGIIYEHGQATGSADFYIGVTENLGRSGAIEPKDAGERIRSFCWLIN